MPARAGGGKGNKNKGGSGDNQRQNKEFKAATQGLTPEQKRMIHDDLEDGSTFQDIREEARTRFEGNTGKNTWKSARRKKRK